MTCWYVGFSDGELYFHGKENINDNNYWWRTKKEGGKKNGEMNVAVQEYCGTNARRGEKKTQREIWDAKDLWYIERTRCTLVL